MTQIGLRPLDKGLPPARMLVPLIPACLGINPVAGLPLLFHELPKSRHDEFTVLFDGFVGDGTRKSLGCTLSWVRQ